MVFSLTNSVVGQVVSNVVSGGSRSNDDDFLPNVFLRSRIREGVNYLTLKLLLKTMSCQRKVG